jgi:DNA-binding transcriptional LysR family regulator
MNELQQIRHALALAQHGNFARAAEALGISQPTLSREIAALESSLGVRLFDRNARGALPTAFGQVLLERGPRILQGVAALRREFELLAGLEVGTLSVGAGPIAGETSVAAALARVARAHPRLAIRCMSGDPDQIRNEVLAGRVDLGVARVTGLKPDERLLVESLPPLRIYLACRPGHPLARERNPSWARAMDFPLATGVLRGAHAKAVMSRDGSLVVDEPGTPALVPHIMVESTALARLLARDSDTLFPGTASMLADDVAAGHLVLLSTDAPVLRTVHGIITLRDRTLAPATRVFIEALREVEAAIRHAEAEGVAAPARPAKRSRAATRRRA